jgi:hypothetical protein
VALSARVTYLRVAKADFPQTQDLNLPKYVGETSLITIKEMLVGQIYRAVVCGLRDRFASRRLGILG